MNRNFYNSDNFEQLLNDNIKEFKMYPSKRVWRSIYNDLHPGYRWPSIAIILMLILATMVIGRLNLNLNNHISKVVSSNNSNNLLARRNFDAHQNFDALNSNFISAIVTDINNNKRKTFSNANNKPNNITRFTKTNQINISKSGKPKSNSIETKVKGYTGLSVEKEDISSPEISFLNILPGKDNINNVSNANNDITVQSKKLNNTPSEDKEWMKNYNLNDNKNKPKKWKDKLSIGFYFTPNLNYRTLNSDIQNDSINNFINNSINSDISYKTSLGLETGFNILYAFAKNLHFKTGLQFNYTNYGINTEDINHPVSTSVPLNSLSGYTYNSPRISVLASSSNLQSAAIHNKTYQVSLPLGITYKLASNNSLEWYAAAAIQPTFVFGGKAYILSSDLKNYINEATALRKWNINTGFETYVNYKRENINFQIGPQFRYQLQSTYKKEYGINEQLYNIGIKVGIIKGL